LWLRFSTLGKVLSKSEQIRTPFSIDTALQRFFLMKAYGTLPNPALKI
jgi:hypothetical protein